MTGEIISEIDGSVCTIIIKNSKKRNAMSKDMVEEINKIIKELGENKGIYTLIFTGAGKNAFSSGYDIADSGDDLMEGEKEIKEMLRLIEKFDYPTIGMVNGVAVGAGFELIAACDLRIAATNARLGITPAKIGIVLSDRAIKQILTAIGPTYTKELLFTGKLISAKHGKEIGLLNKVVEQSELQSETYGLADQISSNAPLSLSGMKSIIQTIEDKRTLTNREKEWANNLQEEAFNSQDHKEGQLAFNENRDPKFEGH